MKTVRHSNVMPNIRMELIHWHWIKQPDQISSVGTLRGICVQDNAAIWEDGAKVTLSGMLTVSEYSNDFIVGYNGSKYLLKKNTKKGF